VDAPIYRNIDLRYELATNRYLEELAADLSLYGWRTYPLQSLAAASDCSADIISRVGPVRYFLECKHHQNGFSVDRLKTIQSSLAEYASYLEVRYLEVSAELESDVEPAGEASTHFYGSVASPREVGLLDSSERLLGYGVADTQFLAVHDVSQGYAAVQSDYLSPVSIEYAFAAQQSSSMSRFDPLDLVHASMAASLGLLEQLKTRLTVVSALLRRLSTMIRSILPLSWVTIWSAIATSQKAFFTHHGTHPPDPQESLVAWLFPEGANRPATVA
jgi:hypothetical protein